jgi:CAAX prenyl protease-like protein
MISVANLPVSKESVYGGVAAARITWTGPLTMLAARSAFAILAQVLVTLILAWTRTPDPIRAGTAWWQVTGTLVDVGCLTLLFGFTRREGIHLADLVGLDKGRWRRDVVIGLGILAVMFPVVMIGGSLIARLLVFGSLQPELPAEVMMKFLPLWAVIYSRAIWWVIWSATEEITYNGYALPRLQALTGRTWLAVLMVSVAWALQHAFLPFIADWRVFLYLFIQMLPLVTVNQLLYLRFRRLPPLIVMHWGMDLFAAFMMTSVIR